MTFPCRILSLPGSAVLYILSFSSDDELCKASASCGALRSAVANDELLSYRKRDYLSSIRPTGKDLKKMKKEEKKKKIKAANYNKIPKKDGYRV